MARGAKLPTERAGLLTPAYRAKVRGDCVAAVGLLCNWLRLALDLEVVLLDDDVRRVGGAGDLLAVGAVA